jgi:glycosyltransferase involved in cell wall biosynthesis
MPRVEATVCIPLRSVGTRLERTLDSVLAQQGVQVRVVLLDLRPEGDAGGTAALAALAARHARVDVDRPSEPLADADVAAYCEPLAAGGFVQVMEPGALASADWLVGEMAAAAGGAREVSFRGPLFDATGEGEDAAALYEALAAAGHRVAEDAGASGRRTHVYLHHAPVPLLDPRPDAQRNVARATWATTRLPGRWAKTCEPFDEVWVPTAAARSAFVAGGVDAERVRVVPAGVDGDRFSAEAQPLAIAEAGFIFLSVFDWTLRKGWDVLVDAYLDEFSTDDDVALVLKPTTATLGVSAQQAATALEARIRDRGHDPEAIPELVLEWGDLPAESMPSLYRTAQCFVLPTRGEGYGRALLEAQACAVPAIATDWGAAAELLPTGSPLRLHGIESAVPEAAAREVPALTRQRWAEPDAAHLRELMRAAVADPQRMARLGDEAAAWVRERPSPDPLR